MTMPRANDSMQSCPTSKCTWPPYETLGVCSQCADISSHLKYACITSGVDWIANLTGGWSAKDTYPNATMCGYFLNATSEDPILMSGHLIESNHTNTGEALIMRTLPLTTLLSKEPLFGNGSIHFKHIRNTIADVLIVSSASGSAETVYQKVPPVSQECVLSWCVKTVISSYDYGEYREIVSDTYLNTTEGLFPWIGYPFMDDLGGGTDIFYLQDIDITGTTSDGRNFTGYGTANDTALTVMQALNDIIPAFTTVNDTWNQPVMRYKIYKNGPASTAT